MSGNRDSGSAPVTVPFRVGEWTCRPSLRRLSGPAGKVQLEPKVLQVLQCLASRPGQVWTRGELLDAVWEGGAVSEQVLSRAVSELRRAFDDDPRSPRAIETIAKSGYRLLLPVEAAEPQGGDRIPAVRGVVSRPRRAGAVWVVLALLVGLGAGWWLTRRETPAPQDPAGPVRASLLLPSTELLDLAEERSFALSPDGRTLVYAATQGGAPSLYVRHLDSGVSEPLVGGEGGYGPFFSADGRHVGFYSAGSLRRVSVEGGDPVTLVGDASDALGAAWGSGGTIIFTRRWLEGLWWMPPGEGPRPLTELRVEEGERSHLWPALLPGERQVVFTVWRGGGVDSSVLVAMDLESGRRNVLLEGAADARFVAPDLLVFAVAGGVLSWARLDRERLELAGPVESILDGLRQHPASGAAHFAVAADRVLVWADWDSASARRALYRVDAEGTWGPPVFEPGAFATPQTSPDGSRIALTRSGRSMQIWLYDLERGSEERLTVEGESLWPLWMPDGRAIAFSSERDGAFNLYRKEARSDAPVERLTVADNLQFPGSWSPDGRQLAFSEFHPESRWDIWLLTLDGERSAVPFLDSKFDEFRPTFSPDGRLLAYVSNELGRWDELGRWEVFVRPLATPHVRLQVSTGGGGDPCWSADGRRLYFRQADRLMSVPLTPYPDLELGEPRVELSGLRLPEAADMMPTYSLLPDGGAFVVRLAEPTRPAELHLQLGGLPWSEAERP